MCIHEIQQQLFSDLGPAFSHWVRSWLQNNRFVVSEKQMKNPTKPKSRRSMFWFLKEGTFADLLQINWMQPILGICKEGAAAIHWLIVTAYNVSRRNDKNTPNTYLLCWEFLFLKTAINIWAFLANISWNFPRMWRETRVSVAGGLITKTGGKPHYRLAPLTLVCE